MRAGQEARRPGHRRRHRPAVPIPHRHEQQRKLGEELPVLVGHRRLDRGGRQHDAGPRLRRPLAGVEHVHGYASVGAGERAMGTNPGSASTRPSQARTAGQGSSATPPSGAWAT